MVFCNLFRKIRDIEYKLSFKIRFYFMISVSPTNGAVEIAEMLSK